MDGRKRRIYEGIRVKNICFSVDETKIAILFVKLIEGQETGGFIEFFNLSSSNQRNLTELFPSKPDSRCNVIPSQFPVTFHFVSTFAIEEYGGIMSMEGFCGNLMLGTKKGHLMVLNWGSKMIEQLKLHELEFERAIKWVDIPFVTQIHSTESGQSVGLIISTGSAIILTLTLDSNNSSLVLHKAHAVPLVLDEAALSIALNQRHSLIAIACAEFFFLKKIFDFFLLVEEFDYFH